MPFNHDIIIIIAGMQARLSAFKTTVDAVEANWNNLNGDQQEAAESVFDDFVAWTTMPASYPGANVKIDQMKTEIEPFQ